MELKTLNQNATQEEINDWIIDTMEKFNTLKTSLETLVNNENTYKERIKSLELANQNLFTKVTTNYNNETNETKEEEYTPTLISKEYFEQLSEEEQENLPSAYLMHKKCSWQFLGRKKNDTEQLRCLRRDEENSKG